jgi:glycosyltransferase involved in cell wall biosynthesis
MSESLTIFFLISSEGYYGAENLLVTLAQSLCRLGCRCIVGVFCDSREAHTEVADVARNRGLLVEMVPCQGRADWNAVKRIRELVIKHHVHVLHPHGYKADLYAYAASWTSRTALLATTHNWPSKLFIMRLYAALDRLVLRRFDKVIGVSEVPTAKLKRSGVPSKKIVTVFNGVDLDRFGATVPTLRSELILDDSALVGFVGRLVVDKGGTVLLHAAKQVLAVRPRTVFVFVGDGPTRSEWETLAIQLGIEKQVVFAGMRENMPEVYASLDLLVLPSLVESMPMCLLEAMAAGKPVIATRVGAVARLIEAGQTGLLVEAGDVRGLATAIVQLLTDPEQLRRIATNGRRQVAEHFSAESMAKSYIRQYEQVLANRRNSGHKQPVLEASPR